MHSGLVRGACAAVVAAAALAAAPVSAAIEHSTLADGSEGIYVTGEIQLGDENRFRALADQHPDAVVYLESPGGAVVAAVEIGKLIREKDYATAVLAEGTCTSSCALVWLAGTRRYLAPGAQLGFHASHMDDGGRLVETGVGNAIVGYYLAQLGMSEKTVVFATMASPYEFSWLTAETSGRADIAFESEVGALPAPDLALPNAAEPLQKKSAAAAVIASEAPAKRAPSAEPVPLEKAPASASS